MTHETPLQSKRFIAYVLTLLAGATIEALLIWAHRGEAPSLVLGAIHLALIITGGFLATYYLGGQNETDRYVRLATIAADAGVRVEHSGMVFHGKADTPAATSP